MTIIDDEIFDFGVQLKKLRKEKDLTQQELADRINLHVKTIGYYENNSRFPSPKNLRKLARFFNTSIDFLLDFEDRDCIYIDDLPIEKRTLIKNIVNTIRKE